MSTWVVVGANRGIGLEITRQAHARGEDVIAVCRSTSDELEALPLTRVTGIDITSDADVARLESTLGDTAIDVLVVVAGVLKHIGLDDLDFQTIRDVFEVNALGPLRVTAALRNRLRAGSKVAWLTSRMGSIADNSSGGAYAYRMSKAALNMAAKSLAVDLHPHDIAVAVLHPGFVRTEMTHGNGLIDADESAAGLIARIDELTVDTSGGFWHANGERLPW